MSLTPNAEIRTKSVKGNPTYALTNDKGEAKFVFKCPFCKKNHQFYHAAHMSVQYKQIFINEGWQNVVLEHLNSCHETQAVVQGWIAAGQIKLEEVAKHFMYRINTYSNYRPTLFNWVDRGDGGHECSAKCRSACGQVCECKCRGRNHGV